MRTRSAIALLAMLALVSACGSESGDGPSPVPAAPSTSAVSGAAIAESEIGAIEQELDAIDELLRGVEVDLAED